MNCEEFRGRYNAWLDQRKSGPLPTEAALHAESCSACSAYAGAISRIDAELQDIPDVPVPEEILAFSGRYGMPAPARGEEASLLLRRGASFVILPLGAWMLSLCIPQPWQPAVQLLLVSGAMAAFAVTSLRPRFVG